MAVWQLSLFLVPADWPGDPMVSVPEWRRAAQTAILSSGPAFGPALRSEDEISWGDVDGTLMVVQLVGGGIGEGALRIEVRGLTETKRGRLGSLRKTGHDQR